MTDLPAGVTKAMVEAAVDAAIARMFAPHEIPVDDELRGKIRDTQVACLTAALAGRVVVPRQPTDAMVEAGAKAIHDLKMDEPGLWEKQPSNYQDVYRNGARVALTAAIPAGRVVVPDWMPIESAPRDGTEIIVTGGGIGDQIDLASYNVRVGAWNTTHWTLDDRDDEAEGYSRPSHWMPAPRTPAVTPGQDGTQ
jgi:hypothetical protein